MGQPLATSIPAPTAATVAVARLLVAAAVGDLVVTAGLAVAVRDIDAAAITVAFVGALAVHHRWARWGALGLAALFANVLFWTGAALASSARYDTGAGAILIPGWLAVVSAGGIVLSLARARRPHESNAGATDLHIGRVVVAGTSAGLVGVAVLALAPGLGTKVQAQPGDVRLEASSARFDDEHLEAPAGTVGLYVRNRDLFWHTVTIDALDVDLRVPTGSARRTTFEAPAGTYEFYCRIPGHESRMSGTLVITG